MRENKYFFAFAPFCQEMVSFTSSIDELTNEIKINALEQKLIVGQLSAFHLIGLVSLEVNEKHRNQGIGSMIMKEYIGW